MNSLALLFLEISISLTLSLTVLKVLSKPLVSALNSMCDSQQQTDFWLAFTRVMMVIFPLLLVMVVNIMTFHDIAKDPVRQTLVTAMIGLVLGMAIMGKKFFSFVDGLKIKD